MAAGDSLRFVKEFVSRPQQIGAILPSSAGLADRMLAWIPWQEVHAVVEFGPGTGAFTGPLLQRVRPDTRVLAVEINPRLAALLQDRFVQLIVCQNDVAQVRQLCDDHGIDQVDAVVCGLPWANFPDRQQQEYLSALIAILRPGGYFATFAYLQGLMLPAARRFRHTLSHWFDQVDRSSVAWGNIPPAIVYRCRR